MYVRTTWIVAVLGVVAWGGWAHERDTAALDSVSVVRAVRWRTAVRVAPERGARLRGFVAGRASFAVLERRTGTGCRLAWYRIHDDAWVCGDAVRPTDEPPEAAPFPPTPSRYATPWPYAFLRESAIEYSWNAHGWLDEVRDVFPGYGFAVDGVVTIDGVRYYRTPERRYIPADAARITARISDFHGATLRPGDPWPIGWVVAKKTSVYADPSPGKGRVVRRLERFATVVPAADASQTNGMVPLRDGGWVRADAVRIARPTPRPDEVKPGERWIDVDTITQILTAYQGDRPVFATLVSTGRRGPSRTITGRFRIWAKVAAIAMDNTDEVADWTQMDADVQRRLYSLQDVPWTQFFHENYALHAVYWHANFGRRMSHGCVNLAPADARWLYGWTAPAVPDGWWSIYATDGDAGTLVQVR